jgi:hypothetical protein
MATEDRQQPLVIDETERALGGGRWVTGSMQHHSFCAKVYAKHPEHPSYELGTSRISKLELRQMWDYKTVATFDRGWEILPRTKAARQVVDSLAASLANRVFPDFADSSPHKHIRTDSLSTPCDDLQDETLAEEQPPVHHNLKKKLTLDF